MLRDFPVCSDVTPGGTYVTICGVSHVQDKGLTPVLSLRNSVLMSLKVSVGLENCTAVKKLALHETCTV